MEESRHTGALQLQQRLPSPYKSDITDFLRYSGGEESADSRLAGGGRAVRTGSEDPFRTKGATLKYRPTLPRRLLLVIDSFATRSVRQTGRIWGGGRLGSSRGRRAITSGRFDPIAHH